MPTNAADAKIAALRTEADGHGDAKTVALCDLALSGDAAARKAVSAMTRGTARAAKAPVNRPAPAARPRGIGASTHPWAHDEE